jgi:hypothetical protein
MICFHQRPDGDVTVYAGNDAVGYIDTLANFETDYGLVEPLPVGVDERIYEPGKRHALMSKSNVIGGGEMPWAWGDQVIARLDALILQKREREYPPLSKEHRDALNVRLADLKRRERFWQDPEVKELQELTSKLTLENVDETLKKLSPDKAVRMLIKVLLAQHFDKTPIPPSEALPLEAVPKLMRR